MKILSIQVGLPRTVEFNGRQTTTGIFKEPIQGPIMVRRLNLEGDGQADLRVHGGVNKAVYAYGADTFKRWKEIRPQDEFLPGAFGENLTMESLREDQIEIGDTFKLGQATLQAVQPRFPCFKLGIKFKDNSILRAFMKMNRPGVYFSVLHEGLIQAGDSLELIEKAEKSVSIVRLFEIFQEAEKDPLEMKRILALKMLPPEIRRSLAGDVED
jgi:MOSC domain-containing protein YiiM